MRKIVCDRCGKEKDMEWHGNNIYAPPSSWSRKEGMDLCFFCKRKYKKQFNQFMKGDKNG